METFWRLVLFVGLFSILFVLERFLARRTLEIDLKRLFSNLGLIAVFNFSMILLSGLAPYGFALAKNGESNLVLSVLIFDLAIYFQHVLTHRVPVLWRFHKVHHSDLEIDTSSALRFHPLEMFFSIGFKILIIFIFDLSAQGVFIGEILLSSGALFSHANIYLPEKLDKYLRWIIVTPDMHRIHHSTDSKQMNSNYGFFFSFWDRIFKSYSHLDFNEQESLELGLKTQRVKEKLYFFHLLTMPFKRP